MIPLVIDLSLSIAHPYFHQTKSCDRTKKEIFQLEVYREPYNMLLTSFQRYIHEKRYQLARGETVSLTNKPVSFNNTSIFFQLPRNINTQVLTPTKVELHEYKNKSILYKFALR